ncbi:TetR/AcrR family transcriptional regulator [Ralstonia sp. UBA689]|uniref:TetR/AcrR family transcriptional regulator n=1 Tax=Ralstonia sp. UBA689 TaxID=1947373 RepID=UPI0025EDAFA7|nr:TetR/AcrR family transcriptional regulator [Ralstonia sp. UBA689]
MASSSNLHERKQRELDQRRRDILKVVRKLVLRGGARELTMRKVAEEAGFSTTVVYALFGDKATLIAQAMDEDLLKLNKLMQQAAAEGDNALERVRRVARAYVGYGLKHPVQYALVFMEQRPAAPVETSTLEYGNPDKDPYCFVYGMATELATEGFIHADEDGLHLITQLLWEGLHGMTSLRIATGDDPWIPRIDAGPHLELMIDVLLLGLLQRFPGPQTEAGVKAISAS